MIISLKIPVMLKIKNKDKHYESNVSMRLTNTSLK